MKSVILCADDYALNESVSRGIVALVEAGRLSATSVMTLSPRWAADAAGLAAWRGRIDVGLHLDWTSEFALAAGHGAPLGALMRRSCWPGLPAAQVRAEVLRQLDRFEQHWGAPPDHVDGHQHVQQFPGLRQAVVDVLAQRYATGPRPYLRISRPVAWQGGLKGRVIAGMGAAALQRLARARGLAVAPFLSGIDDFQSDVAGYAQSMSRWLADAPEACLIMCHPARAAEPGDEIGPARLREWTYLSGPDFAAALQQAQVQLARGQTLLASVP